MSHSSLPPQPDPSWLQADALDVAPKLLGCELISLAGEGLAGGRIVEVEAYHGLEDPASHAYRGTTPRTAPMFLAGGAVYVYRSYGIHRCMNIVTGPAGEAQAVLIRALEPTRGLDLIVSRRHTTNPKLLMSGPGRVGQALELSLNQSGQLLGQSLVLLPPTTSVPPETIAAAVRVGIKTATDRPWRFYLRDNPFVSRRA